jgi:hypothetical protein
MTYKVKRLTRQYNGYTYFKYLIQPTIGGEINARNQLVEWRNWCWETWGPGRELLWSTASTPEAVWAWDTEHSNKRIYLKSDAELVLFQLKW